MDMDDLSAGRLIRSEADNWQTKQLEAENRRARAQAAQRRLEAQIELINTTPNMVAYVAGVFDGSVAPDPEKTKLAIALMRKILPDLGAVRVDAADTAGVTGVKQDKGDLVRFLEATSQQLNAADAERLHSIEAAMQEGGDDGDEIEG